MPIYEYGCPKCRTIFQFWSQKIGEQTTPVCPKCGGKNMKKIVSSFAIGKGQRSTPSQAGAVDDESGMPDPFANMSPEQQAHAEREMMKLMSQADSLDENDPRQMGAFMRKLTESTGMDMGPEMNEAIRRLERGEDPEKIEEEMGDIFGDLGEDPMGGGGYGGWSYDDELYD
ncbi:MAG: FmdB family zinc ribbon protein, partial [Candidatus Hinthialibacter sp.]